MLGLTPAVWMTDATGPRPDAVSNNFSTACRSVTSQLTAVALIPRSASVLAASSKRSCLTSQRTTVWSRPTTLAVARPMPPAPVMTTTELMTVMLATLLNWRGGGAVCEVCGIPRRRVRPTCARNDCRDKDTATAVKAVRSLALTKSFASDRRLRPSPPSPASTRLLRDRFQALWDCQSGSSILNGQL